ncbi:MAG: hypothetical protein WDA59_08875, partial [Methanofastidiosum sp.]
GREDGKTHLIKNKECVKMYRLSSSMSDRINFDSMVRQCGWDAANYLPLDELKKYDNEDSVKFLAEGAWDGALATDIEEQVDDLKEAEARWLSAWIDGFEMRRDLILEANTPCDCCQE